MITEVESEAFEASNTSPNRLLKENAVLQPPPKEQYLQTLSLSKIHSTGGNSRTSAKGDGILESPIAPTLTNMQTSFCKSINRAKSFDSVPSISLDSIKEGFWGQSLYKKAASISNRHTISVNKTNNKTANQYTHYLG